MTLSFDFLDYSDFNGGVMNITFPKDEYSTRTVNLTVEVDIVDDDINEADDQMFVVLLEVYEAYGLDTFDLNYSIGNCHITDNDRKFNFVAIHSYD